MNTLVIVDLQPAYKSGITANLMTQVFRLAQERVEHAEVIAFFVNEELSGDTLESVQDFWRQHGAEDSLIGSIQWVEKSYSFFRGWMDNGIPEEETLQAIHALRTHGMWDTRQLDEHLLEELCPEGSSLCSPLWRDEDVESLVKHLQSLGRPVDTCGGGREECLAEVELALKAARIEVEQLHYLTY